MEKKENQNIPKLKIFDAETSHLTSQKDRKKIMLPKVNRKNKRGKKKK